MMNRQRIHRCTSIGPRISFPALLVDRSVSGGCHSKTTTIRKLLLLLSRMAKVLGNGEMEVMDKNVASKWSDEIVQHSHLEKYLLLLQLVFIFLSFLCGSLCWEWQKAFTFIFLYLLNNIINCAQCNHLVRKIHLWLFPHMRLVSIKNHKLF